MSDKNHIKYPKFEVVYPLSENEESQIAKDLNKMLKEELLKNKEVLSQ